MRDATCEAAEPSNLLGPGKAEQIRRHWVHRFYRYVRVVGRGVLFTGGAALVVVNSVSALDLPDALSSVMGGLATMTQQVEQQEGEPSMVAET